MVLFNNNNNKEEEPSVWQTENHDKYPKLKLMNEIPK